MWFYYRNFLAFFRIPTPLAIFPEIYDICSFQVKLQSIIRPRNFVFLTCVAGSFSIFRKISFSEAPRFLKNIWWVFLIFSDNLFAFSHRTISVHKNLYHLQIVWVKYVYIQYVNHWYIYIYIYIYTYIYMEQQYSKYWALWNTTFDFKF